MVFAVTAPFTQGSLGLNSSLGFSELNNPAWLGMREDNILPYGFKLKVEQTNNPKIYTPIPKKKGKNK